MSHLGSFISTVNQIRTCTTSGCKGNLAPVAVRCRGLGGAITVRYSCDGCGLKGATFEAHSKCETVLAGSNTISVSLQVAFIIVGCTHATYCKALSHSLGIDAVSAPTFMCTIRAMHSIVESMLDEVCEAAWPHALITPTIEPCAENDLVKIVRNGNASSPLIKWLCLGMSAGGIVSSAF